MLRGEPLTVTDLELPVAGTALDRMTPPTLDAWTAAIATVRAREVSRTSPTARGPDWFERTALAIVLGGHRGG